MKSVLFSIFLLLIALYHHSYADYNSHIGIPEDAIARLGKGGINLMQFSPDGTKLAVGTDVGMWIYNVATGQETPLFPVHTGEVNALAFSSDGSRLASGGRYDSGLHIWNTKSNKLLSTHTN